MYSLLIAGISYVVQCRSGVSEETACVRSWVSVGMGVTENVRMAKMATWSRGNHIVRESRKERVLMLGNGKFCHSRETPVPVQMYKRANVQTCCTTCGSLDVA